MTEPVVIALIGIMGAVIGSVATVASNIASHFLKERAASLREKPQRELLLEMLLHPEHEWRKLDTLRHVIGADEATAKRLLLEIGARASEDGQALWALKSRKPLRGSADYI